LQKQTKTSKTKFCTPVCTPVFKINNITYDSINYQLKDALSENKLQQLSNSDKEKAKKEINKPRNILMVINQSGKRLKIYTNRKSSSAQWIRGKQMINCRKMTIGCDEINEFLVDFKKAVTKYCFNEENQGNEIDINEVKNILKKMSTKGIDESDILEQFNLFLKEYKNEKGFSLRHNTVKKYISLCNHLIDYFEDRNIEFSLQRLNRDFFNKFKKYLMWEAELSDNTVAKYIKTLKTFVRYYINKGEINYFELSSIASKEKEGEIYVLSIKQILHLQNLDIKNEAWANARDVFCFMCWTGQRYSDIEKIKRNEIKKHNGDYYWELITSKTGEKIKVPLIEYALTILDKYKNDDKPLPVISNQKINEHLKKIGEKADFKESAKVILYYDGREDVSFVPFYEVLTTHVARKSYITNSLILGVSERVVREISGHKDEKSFARYVKLAESYKNKVIQEAFSESNIARFV